jgi:Ala-tRNA(Pro) deacylase
MAIPRNVKQYLFHNSVIYTHKKHPLAFTSQEIAEADHIPGGEFAKTVVLEADQKMIFAVLPGDHLIDIDELKQELGCETLRLASEKAFMDRFPSCEPGAMPPFGRLFGMPVYCDDALAGHDEVEFNAGTHIDTVRMRFSNFIKLEEPIMQHFSEKARGQRRRSA